MAPKFIAFHFLAPGFVSQAIFFLSLLCFTVLAMIVHELGHWWAARQCGVSVSELGFGLGPRLGGVRLGAMNFSLRAIPVASFLRIDGSGLSERPLAQQLFVHLGGIIFNLVFGMLTFGTPLGGINLLLALGNVLPLYKHDGWKCGLLLMRALMRRPSKSVEWTFTASGCFVSVIVLDALLHLFQFK